MILQRKVMRAKSGKASNTNNKKSPSKLRRAFFSVKILLFLKSVMGYRDRAWPHRIPVRHVRLHRTLPYDDRLSLRIIGPAVTDGGLSRTSIGITVHGYANCYQYKCN